MSQFKPAETSVSPILPLSNILVHFHGKSLFGPMKEWKLQKRLPPVLLLTGPAGIGKRSMAYFLGQWVLCENPQLDPPLPCNVCLKCRQAFEGNWTHFTEISSGDESEESQSLKIDQFREMKAASGFGSFGDGHKIVLIPNADRMTLQAANSVLKILEEPPQGWIFLLTANDPTLLLPTIVSRCQKLRLKPLPEIQLLELLKEKGIGSSEVHVLIARSAHGSLGRALALGQEDTWKQRALVFNFLKTPDQSLNSLVDWASSQNSHFEIFLDLFEQLTADLIRWSIQSEQVPASSYSWIHEDYKSELVSHTQKTIQTLTGLKAAQKFWVLRAERFAQARHEATTPMNRKILIQDLLIPWLL